MTEEERTKLAAKLHMALWLDVSKKRLPVLVASVVNALDPLIEEIKEDAYEAGRQAMQEAIEES